MAIERLRRPPLPVTLTPGALTRYQVELSAVPSSAWRTALLRPPAPLTTARYTPGLLSLDLDGSRLMFLTIPSKLHVSLQCIDQWIAYANSVVAE